MSLDAAAVVHFRAGRAALIRKRDECDALIAEVDRILSFLSADEPSTSAPQPDVAPNPATPRPGTTRAIVLDLLADRREWRVSSILDSLTQAGTPSSENSVRSLLAKMVRDGLLTNPARGVYRLQDDTPPMNAEGPTVAAAEPSGVSLLEEGGNGSDGQGSHHDAVGTSVTPHDTHASVPNHRAPVMGLPN